MSNWVYSGRITKDNIAKFHEDFDGVGYQYEVTWGMRFID